MSAAPRQHGRGGGAARRISAAAWAPGRDGRVWGLALLAATLAGCEPAPSGGARSGAAPPVVVGPVETVFRGHAVLGHEVRAFRPCGADEALWTIDRSGRLWELHRELARPGEPYGEVFAVIEGRRGPAPAEGFGAAYPGAIELSGIRYVANEGLGCASPWERFAYRAQGNEPFWTAEAAGGALRLSRPGEDERRWPDLQPERGPEGLRLTADDPAPVALAISPEPCRDSMSGAWYAASAVLTLGGAELRGCAVQGLASLEAE